MALTKNEWVCRFIVGNPSRHRKGFTIYKLTSLVHPQAAPEAATKLVVWKRHNDFKKLHKRICDACKMYSISESPPTIPKGSFFNRFEQDVINDRVKSAQALLDFIGRHKVLFLGDTVQNFCETGYNVTEPIPMGQASVTGFEGGEEGQRWSEDLRWRSDVSQDSSPSYKSESSEDESRSADSAPCPYNNNNSTTAYRQNNNSPQSLTDNATTKDPESVEAHDVSIDVEDPAGPGEKPLSGPPPDRNAVVICHAEKPVATNDVWLTLPSAEERLSAYHVVGIFSRLLLVCHRVCPARRLVLKVYRKSSWPVMPVQNVGEPRPIPHMVRLFDYIETEDAVFVVLEHAARGLLMDYAARLQDRAAPSSLSESTDPTDVDVDVLVAHAQRLLASVTKTLKQSEVATSLLHDELRGVESKLTGQGGHKPRSSSATPRARLERRFSCDDGKSHRPRTAHASLDRSVQWSRSSEDTIRGWAVSLVAAIDTLHSRGIIWRDLHPGNLLVGEGGTLLMSFQHWWLGVEPPLHPQAVAGMFVAPEARSVLPVTAVADWWSVGVILYKLLTGVALVEVHPCGISSHTILELPDFLSVEAKSLLSELLQYEPSERLGSSMNGAEDIRCHPFFALVDWDEGYRQDKVV